MSQQKYVRWIVYAVVLAILTGCAAPWHTAPGAVVAVHPDKPGPVIPDRFLGLSFEAKELANPQIDARNSALVHMLALLGPGVLRFGGNLVERTFWKSAPPGTGSAQQYVVTRTDLERVFGFARQVGWQVILGVNLQAGTPEQAADEIAAAADIGGPLLLAVEIGNEADLYKPQWSIDQYRESFNTFAAAIRARVPHVAFVGPDSSWGHWLPPFVESHGPQLSLATYHYYPLFHSAKQAETDPTYPSVEHLLSPGMLEQTGQDVRKYVAAARNARLPLRIDETNSISGGGEKGVSDVFAATLWMAQYLFTVAQQGAAGVNVHGGLNPEGKPFYTLLRAQPTAASTGPRYVATPPFYGMLLFHYGAVGQLVTTTLTATGTITPADTLTAFAARAADGKLRVTLINADSSHDHLVDVQLGGFYTNYSVLRLQAPSLTARDHITMDQASISPAGRWRDDSAGILGLNSSTVEVAVPAASALVLTLTPSS